MTSSNAPPEAKRILIFLLGSLGDTLVAIPSLHLIAQRYPHAERRILTHFPINQKAAPMSALLAGTGLVHGYIRFPAGARDRGALRDVISEVRRWGADLLIHLHEPRGRLNALRDGLFFRACGIRQHIGIPFHADLQEPRYLPDRQRYEQRADYLARKLKAIGDPALGQRSSWDLHISNEETGKAESSLEPLAGSEVILAMSIGTKAEVNDWGDDYWHRLLAAISRDRPGWGLVAIGAASERERTGALLASWRGHAINLCGDLSVRQSAAVLGKATLFVGHDSGPMHLAASMGTRCVAIFSSRNLPGLWFPYGEGHRVFYRDVECRGCELLECPQFQKKCIRGIQPEEVASAINDGISLV
jgi:ADP-heptose:LPS heptosyltransferase